MSFTSTGKLATLEGKPVAECCLLQSQNSLLSRKSNHESLELATRHILGDKEVEFTNERVFTLFESFEENSIAGPFSTCKLRNKRAEIVALVSTSASSSSLSSSN